MNDPFWRLAWALPLVIAIGLALIYWLKRLGLGQGGSGEPVQPIVRSSTALTEHTRVLVVEVNLQTFVVFESDVHIAVQPQDAHAHTTVRHPFMTGSSVMPPWRQYGRKS